MATLISLIIAISTLGTSPSLTTTSNTNNIIIIDNGQG